MYSLRAFWNCASTSYLQVLKTKEKDLCVLDDVFKNVRPVISIKIRQLKDMNTTKVWEDQYVRHVAVGISFGYVEDIQHCWIRAIHWAVQKVLVPARYQNKTTLQIHPPLSKTCHVYFALRIWLEGKNVILSSSWWACKNMGSRKSMLRSIAQVASKNGMINVCTVFWGK